MWAFLLVAIVVAFSLLKTREQFVVKYGNPFDGEDLLSFDGDAKGNRLFSTNPDSCPRDEPEYDAGLCYKRCDEGYHGVGPVCWASTHNRGSGKAAKPKSCTEMGLGREYRDDPLTCWKDLKCTTKCSSTWDWSSGGFCKTKCSGPDLKGKSFKCTDPEYPDLVGLLCYKKCPANKPRYLSWAFPYLCTAATRGISYERGVGSVPPILRFGD
jgi:hypothetical protein